MDAIVKKLMEHREKLAESYIGFNEYLQDKYGISSDDMTDDDYDNYYAEYEEYKRGLEESSESSESTDSVSNLLSMSMDDPLKYAKALRAAVEDFKKDYTKIPKGMDGLSFDYNESKRNIYRKYKPLADECKKVLADMKISGYGRMDAIKVEIKKLCDLVDYNFPYGWKNM